LNNDNWLRKKKGYAFMSEKERKEILLAIKGVDRVVLTSHKRNDPDRTVCRELRKIKPNIFANGGDRKKGNTPEGDVCQEIGCKMVFGVGKGGKVQSSSWLLKEFGEMFSGACPCGSGKKYRKCHGV
jgi:glycerol-3-phosphate cytidylyltransferase-like family protein